MAMRDLKPQRCQQTSIHGAHIYPAADPRYWCGGHKGPDKATMVVQDGKIVRLTGVGAMTHLADGEYNLITAQRLEQPERLGLSPVGLFPGRYDAIPADGQPKVEDYPDHWLVTLGRKQWTVAKPVPVSAGPIWNIGEHVIRPESPPLTAADLTALLLPLSQNVGKIARLSKDIADNTKYLADQKGREIEESLVPQAVSTIVGALEGISRRIEKAMKNQTVSLLGRDDLTEEEN